MRHVGRAPRRFSLSDVRPEFREGDTAADLERALIQLHGQVGHDLATEDVRDDAFVDYAGDQMSDARVPDDLIDAAQAWLRRGGAGHIQWRPA